MFNARLEAAAFGQPSPQHTPIIEIRHDIPAIVRQRNAEMRSSNILPRSFANDMWLYVIEINTIVGRVMEHIMMGDHTKVVLDDRRIFIIMNGKVKRGKHNKKSLHSMHTSFVMTDSMQ